ncbi:SycD/LcrH family type III secretion system chaperone [Pantoea sp. Mb-10]|uniref:SycD/LcrH family type III secretion system chaperone n=1 Tax=unclassified Pantoea TaxID=2630326 RepID=UPI001E4402BA|nr:MULTISPECIES: SycD/LcrH family type III secretion system chaperone [unclassified Pantoea]MCE0489030.1 SycD/LcrH family type III secretion system chaperone [Pantoea sp. Mb-10]MCE0503614.1 SycD/LcrH family type III secretion system chaperone [Pantoea sp. Pb-8]
MAMKVTRDHNDDHSDMALQLMEYIQRGITLRDIEDVSDETMEEMYACAYYLYQERRLEEAEVLFKLLCMYDFNNADYVIGLGSVHQLKRNYQKACDFYALAFVMAEENYLPMLYGGQCNLLMGNIGKALQCFKNIIDKCSDEKIKARARIYIDTIKSKRSK